MLSEGWDAKNVTHIMGLRAFTSQLLCEQVVGRGLRRGSYDTDENGLFLPEYVNVFGVRCPSRKPAKVASRLRLRGRPPRLRSFRIGRKLRVATVKPQLNMAWDKVPALVLDPASTPISAELAPALGGATDMGKVTAIDLERLPEGFRLQRLVRLLARALPNCVRVFWNRGVLVRIVESLLNSRFLEIPSLSTPILCVAAS